MRKVVISISILAALCFILSYMPEDEHGKHVKIEQLDKEYNEKEMFVEENGEISAYSFVFSEYCFRENKKRVQMSIMLDDDYKRCRNLCDDNDTSAVSTEPLNLGKYVLCDYSSFLKELESCMDAASKCYDIKNLSLINFFSSYLQEVSVSASINLFSTKPKKGKWYSNEEMIEAIRQTTFEDDLNKIIGKYGLKAGKIFIDDGHAWEIDKKKYIKRYLKNYEGVKNIYAVPMSVVISCDKQ